MPIPAGNAAGRATRHNERLRNTRRCCLEPFPGSGLSGTLCKWSGVMLLAVAGG